MGWTLWTETDTSCTPIQPVCRCQGLGVLQFPFHKHYHEHSNRHSGGVTLVQAWKLKFGKINFFEYILNHYIKKAYTLIFLQKENRDCNLLHSAKIAKIDWPQKLIDTSIILPYLNFISTIKFFFCELTQAYLLLLPHRLPPFVNSMGLL